MAALCVCEFSSGACRGLETVATAHWRYLEVQGRILGQAAPFYQRLRGLFAAENLSQHLLISLVVFAEVSANTALTVVDCDHVVFLRVNVTQTSYAPAARPI
jgi:hypothetical protein